MPLSIPNTVTCPVCHTDFEHYFTFNERVEVAQDVTDDDVVPELVSCLQCGHKFIEEFSGWISHDDAG